MASQQQIYSTLLSVGATPAEAQTLSAIAMAESGGRNDAYNPNGEDSVGWYQINLRAHGANIDFAGAQDPGASSRYALKLFREQGGQPWSVTHQANGRPYLQYMNTPLEGGMQDGSGGLLTPEELNGGTTEAPPAIIPGTVLVSENGTRFTVRGVDGGVLTGTSGADLSDTGSNIIRIPAGTYQLPGLNKSVAITANGTIVEEGTTPNPGEGPASGQLIPTGIPGLMINPNTGGLVNLFDEMGGGSGSGPTITGSSAPDPIGAASIMLRAYEDMIANANGTFDAEKAFSMFQADWQSLLSTVNTSNAQLQSATNIAQGNLQADTNSTNVANVGNYLTDATTRARDEASRALGVAQEAGNRADTVATKILPNWIQGASHLNVPLIGEIPLTQLNVNDLFSQGGQGDLSNVVPISPNPAIPFAPVQTPMLPQAPQAPMPGPMPNFPAPPQYGAPPDVTAMIQAALRGFSGFQF